MSIHSRDNSADRLLQLSQEVSRIAGSLARLSTIADPILDKDRDVPDVSVEQITKIIRARRLRERYFASDLFADPAWDIMLNLLSAELSHRRVAVSNLTADVAVPATTALRWIKSMTSQGLLTRHPDPFDGRRVFIELSPEASAALRRYFGELGDFAPV